MTTDKRPKHMRPYKIVCISVYLDDLARMDALVKDLKERGLMTANRSALIRFALGQVKPDQAFQGLRPSRD